jgi:hypothetical protein
MDQSQKREPAEIKLGKIYATKWKSYIDPVTMEPVPEYVIVTEKKSDMVIFHYVSDLEKHPMGKTVKSFLQDFKETWNDNTAGKNIQRKR